MAVKFKEKCKKCFHFQVCENVLQNDLSIREVMLGEKEPECKQFVEVVRCKDCEYAKPYDRGDGRTGYYCQHPNSTFLYGANWERIFEPVRESSDFCSHGKKKEA